MLPSSRGFQRNTSTPSIEGSLPKSYDRAYFDRWYRGSRRVSTAAETRRKVTLALATAEYFLHSPVRSVLDAGCGEGAWLAHLRALRPAVRYLGIDPSDYVVRRFGAIRNIRQGSFSGIARIAARRRFDLVVCSDVLHYLDEDEIRAGVHAIATALRGVVFLDVLTSEDSIAGDLEGLHQRKAGWYAAIFRDAGLTRVGPYCWIGEGLRDVSSPLEFDQS